MPMNMAYCRFENTLAALRECDDALGEIDDNLAELSKEENRKAGALIQLCRDIAERFDTEQP